MSKYVNKDSLIHLLSDSLNITKGSAQQAIDLIFMEMSDALASEGIVDISGFGKFYIFNRKERMGINPITKERMKIEASKLPKFKPSQTLKNKCNHK